MTVVMKCDCFRVLIIAVNFGYSIAEKLTSISKCVVNEDYMDSVGVSGESGDQELAADSVHGFAVEAFACFFAWDI